MTNPTNSRIDTLATSGWFRGLMLDNQNELADVSIFRILFEKVKGCFSFLGGIDRSNERLITFKALEILKTEQTQATAQQIAKFAKRTGLIANNRTVPDSAQLVAAIATKLFKTTDKSYTNLESIQSEFYTRNQGVLKPFFNDPNTQVVTVVPQPATAPQQHPQPAEDINAVIVVNEQTTVVTTVVPQNPKPAEEVNTVILVNEHVTEVMTTENKPVAEHVKIDSTPVEPKKTSLLMKCANYAIGTIGGLAAAKTVIESPVEKPASYTLTEQEAIEWAKRDLTPGTCPSAESMSKWKVVNIINEWLTDEVSLTQCAINKEEMHGEDVLGQAQAIREKYGRFSPFALNPKYPAIEYGLVYKNDVAQQSEPFCYRRWRVNEDWNWPDMEDVLKKTASGFTFDRNGCEGGRGTTIKMDCIEKIDNTYSTLFCEATVRPNPSDTTIMKFVETRETVLNEYTFDACVSENGSPCVPQPNENGEVLKNMLMHMNRSTQTADNLKPFNWSQYGVTALGAAIVGGCAHRAFQAFKRFGATCRNPETTFWERVETGVIPVMWIGLGVLNTYATMAAVEDLKS